jgi:DNA-directed RNA polymerase subunit RPC12/RpoP
MNEFSRPFIPGQSDSRLLPLSRYLPPIPAGMIGKLLQHDIPPGNFLVDPLGATPLLPLEAARCGYRILVASNNPILTFILEVLASAPKPEDFQAAIAELSMVRRGQERLDTHLQSIYETECAACNHTIPSEAFLWRKDENIPFARLYRCPNCGDEGEKPFTGKDQERLLSIGSAQLHRSRAIERISTNRDELYAGAEEALRVYLTRPIYFLFTLINKIEGLQIQKDRRRLLLALILSVCDSANALWPWPGGRTRPRQLSLSPVFRENNLWHAFEASAQEWIQAGAEVPLSHWPDLPPENGGICIFPGRLKNLLPLPNNLPLRFVVSVFPRPNQAFWTLSALWSGWLWGHEAVQPLKSALERRRYDWHWHAAALQSPMHLLIRHAEPDISVLGVLPELAPGFLSAAMVAMDSSGFILDDLALHTEQELVQIVWRRRNSSPKTGSSSIVSTCKEAIQSYLIKRNEPAAYLTLHTAALAALSRAGLLYLPEDQGTGEALNRIQTSLAQVFTDTAFLKRSEGSAKNYESGLWWLAVPPLSKELTWFEKIEMELVRYLQKNPGCTFQSINETLCEMFTGLLTPSDEVIQLCLASYAEPFPNDTETWQLRSQENPSNRRIDLDSARDMLVKCANRLGYKTSGENPLLWLFEKGQPAYIFYFLASSIISRFIIHEPAPPPAQNVLVLPASRSRLIVEKLRRNPSLAQALSTNWHFLKLRHIRLLADRSDLTIQLWQELLDSDPPQLDETAQMVMFRK